MKYKTRIILFFAAMTLFHLAANFANPITPTVIKELHLHDYMFGLATAAMMVTNFLTSPFWGKINTYISARVTLLVCCLGFAVAQLVFAYSTTELGIVLARMICGLFVGGILVSFLTYIIGTSQPEDQGRFLTYCATIQSVASAFGYMVGGLLGEISIMTVFFAQIGMMVVIGISFYVICKPVREEHYEKISIPRLTKEANPFKAFMDSKQFMCASLALLFSINIFVNFSNTSFDQAFNYYLKDALGLTPSYNGIIKAGVGFISFAANMTLCVWLINKRRIKHSMLVITIICTLSAVGTTVSSDILFFILFSVLLYAGYSVSLPVLQSVITNSATQEQKNLVIGFYNSTTALGNIAGSMLAGFVYSLHEKLPFACTTLGYCLSAAAAFYYVIHSNNKKASYRH